MSSTQPGSIQPAYPGQQLPVVLPPPAGSNGSIHQNASALNQQSIDKQTSINNTGGSRRSKSSRRIKKQRRFSSKRKGGASSITVAVPPVSYPEQGASGQTIAGVSTQATSVGTSSTENSKYDACMGQGASCTQKIGGGRRRKKMKGGCPSPWGCMSGGKRSKRRRGSKKRKGSKKRRGSKKRKGKKNH